MLLPEWSTLGLYVVVGVVCYLLHACMLSLEWSTLVMDVVTGVVYSRFVCCRWSGLL